MPGPTLPLRILHVAPYSPEAWAYGGIPRVVSGMLEGLEHRGHKVALCATDACDATSRVPDHAPGRTGEWRVLRNVSNRAAFHLQAFAPRGLDHYLSSALDRFDIVHLHACHNILTARAARHCAARGIPFVLSPNGTAPVTERRRLLKRAFRVATGDRALELADRVLAASGAEADALCRLGVSRARIDVVPNPVEAPPPGALLSSGILRAMSPRISGPVVLFLGKVTPRKHVPTLVDAVRRLSRDDVHLVIAGSDQGGLRTALASEAARHLAGRLHVLGVLHGPERFAALAEADVVAYPSADEAFGLVACEALVCGTPVVVGDDGGCGEIVRTVGGGLTVTPGDSSALAVAIARVLAEPVVWNVAAAAASVRIREDYSRDHVATALERIYAGLIGREERRLA